MKARPMPVSGITAALVLFVWWLGHHAYKLAPVEIEGHAWNMGGGAAGLVLVALVALLAWHPLVHVPASWVAAEYIQQVGCTVAYVINPWPMQPGQEKCSEALGLPIQAVCLVALLWTGAWLLDRFREGRR